MTYAEAMAKLPANVAWSCSFGWAGEGGCKVHFRTQAGELFVVSNGPYDALKPFDWQLKKVEN